MRADGLREGQLLSAFGSDRFAHKLGDLLLATAEPLGARAQAACARMLGQLDGNRHQDERVTALRAELTIISTQLKEGELMIGGAARRLRPY
jgi:hypothetical protein